MRPGSLAWLPWLALSLAVHILVGALVVHRATDDIRSAPSIAPPDWQLTTATPRPLEVTLWQPLPQRARPVRPLTMSGMSTQRVTAPPTAATADDAKLSGQLRMRIDASQRPTLDLPASYKLSTADADSPLDTLPDLAPRASNGTGSGQRDPTRPGETVAYGPFSARVAADGSMRFDNHNLSYDGAGVREGGVGASVKFDVNDAIMRAFGYDPYQLRKLAILDRTRDARLAVAKNYRARQQQRAAADMNAWLARIWSDRAASPSERRAAILAVWDACVETGEQEAILAGQRARAEATKFIAAHMAPRVPAGFTVAELEAFNARRRSTARLPVGQ